MPKLSLSIFKPWKGVPSIVMNGRTGYPHSQPIIIVHANKLDDLLSRPDCETITLDKPYKVVRFLLRPDGDIVFAAAGAPFGHIAEHYKMTNSNWLGLPECASAGEAYFDNDNKLCGINNLSYDFETPFDTLQFVLKAVAKLQMPMVEKLLVREFSTDHHLHQKDYSVNSEDILPPSTTLAPATTTDLPETQLPSMSFYGRSSGGQAKSSYWADAASDAGYYKHHHGHRPS